MKKLIYILALPALLLTACGGEEKKEEPNKNQADEAGGGKGNDAPAESCSFMLDKESGITIKWEAYKHTAKVPVSGYFEDITVTSTSSHPEFTGAMENINLSINTHSINTQDTSRDRKIEQFFFDVLTATETIDGSLKDVEGNMSAGNGTLSMKFNSIEGSLPFDYKVNGEDVTIIATMDLKKWEALEAVASLNEVCKEKHTGDDGITKVWDDVKIVISGKIKKDCEVIAAN